MRTLSPMLIALSASLLLSACFSVRKNEAHLPVYKRKEALPVYSAAGTTPAAATPVSAPQKPLKNPEVNAPVAPAEEPAPVPPPPPQAAPPERIHRMVHESRQEIIASGMSPAYVDAHFTVVEMVDEDQEKKVVWNYTLGSYSIQVTDLVTWTQDAAGNITYTHSIRQEWGTTRDIETVLSPADAEMALKNCIGEFEQAVLKFTALELPGSASPWLTARSLQPAPGGTEGDKIFLQGYLNLETGACHKEIAGVVHAPKEDK